MHSTTVHNNKFNSNVSKINVRKLKKKKYIGKDRRRQQLDPDNVLYGYNGRRDMKLILNDLSIVSLWHEIMVR